MAKVLVGVTGSVAAIYTPALFATLKQAGHQVKVVATDAALYFFDPASVDAAAPGKSQRNPEVVIVDSDEWPGREHGRRYQRSDTVLHIELRRWADILLIAPLDANTLAKLANGLADNCLTCVWRAWDRNRPVVLAPAMNTLMWQHPLTVRHLRELARDFQSGSFADNPALNDLITLINTRCLNLRVLPPQSKRLACDDVGVGAMASADTILETMASVWSVVRSEA